MKVITGYSTQLLQNMSSTQNTMPVSSLLTDDGHTIVAADFDSFAFFVIEPGSVNQEIISATGTNATGFTGLTRGLAFYGSSVAAVTANQKSHQAGSTVILSNVHFYYDRLVDLDSAETITGIKTFATGATPLITDIPTTGLQATNKDYVDAGLLQGAPDASDSTKGVTKLTVAPASPTNPIAVGANDNKVPTVDTSSLSAGQLLAMSGDNTDIAVGSGNKYVTQTGLQKTAEVYAATATGNDTYVITLSPIPTSLINGMHLRFKVDVGNTGPATLNPNSLGPINLVTGLSTALVTGDIVANQIVEVVYNSTGPVFQVLNPASAILKIQTFTNGVATKATSDASVAQTLAHGLGVVPKKVKIIALGSGGTPPDTLTAITSYNGSTQSSVSFYGSGTSTFQTDATFTLQNVDGASNGYKQVGVVTFDATNITITWTGTGGASAVTYNLMWEAQA